MLGFMVQALHFQQEGIVSIGTLSVIVGVVLLLSLKLFFKDEKSSDQNNGIHGVDYEEVFKEDLDFDPSWSVLSSNTHYTEDNRECSFSSMISSY